jgi:hypothetical protein
MQNQESWEIERGTGDEATKMVDMIGKKSVLLVKI